ncbi:recombinase family protein [Actinosynnema sp. NPDC023794]
MAAVAAWTDDPAVEVEAVIYLRVSTKRQAKKGYNPDGYSIPAQEMDCRAKAGELKVNVVAVFVDKGESARTTDRPEFLKMMEFIKERRPRYLIVHKLDRWARDRVDDVLMHLQVKASGAQLVSVKENIDESPQGELLHGILASLNAFYSANLSQEVLKGMQQKVMEGGTPTRAPIGYFNGEERLPDGRVIRTVLPDPERFDLIALAFELYETGNYSLHTLVDALTVRGLRTRPYVRNPLGNVVSTTQMSRILHNAYYMGDVSWHGLVYPGRHKPLVSRERFDRVQEVLAEHDLAGDRSQRHTHYLKGTVFCGRCESRLSLTLAKETYLYFFCLGRARGNGCDMPFIEVSAAEELVAQGYNDFVLPTVAVEAVREDLALYLEEQANARAVEMDRHEKRVTRLKEESRKILRAHLADAMPLELLKEEQERISSEMAEAEVRLAALRVDHSTALVAFDEVMPVLTGISRDTYMRYTERGRRAVNQLLLTKALLFDTDEPAQLKLSELGETVEASVLDAWHNPQDQQARSAARAVRSTSRAHLVAVPDPDDERPQATGVAAGVAGANPLVRPGLSGSNFRQLERVTGIEPA